MEKLLYASSSSNASSNSWDLSTSRPAAASAKQPMGAEQPPPALTVPFDFPDLGASWRWELIFQLCQKQGARSTQGNLCKPMFLLPLPYTKLPLPSPASSRWSSKHYYRSIPSPISLSLSPHLPTTEVILVLLTPTSASESSLRSLYKRQSQGDHIFNWDSGFLSLLFLCSSCVILLFPKPAPYTPAMLFADALFDHKGGSWSVTAGTGIGPSDFGSSPILPSGWALSSSTDFDLQASGTEVWQSLVFYSFLFVALPACLWKSNSSAAMENFT